VDNSKSSNNVSFYLNNNTPTLSTVSPTALNIQADIFTVGRIAYGSPSNSFFYDGLVSEVIFFNRKLKIHELTDIQCYLSKKYKILVSNISC